MSELETSERPALPALPARRARLARLDRLDLGAALVDFAAHHQARANRLCHFVGIPAIAAAALGAVAHLRVPVLDVDGGLVLLALTLVLDLALNVRLAVGVFVLGLLLYAGARRLPGEALGVLFAVGWTCQLVGHRVFEKNAPAFVDNLVHLFVGPRWIVNRLLRVLPDVVAPSGAASSPRSVDASPQ